MTMTAGEVAKRSREIALLIIGAADNRASEEKRERGLADATAMILSFVLEAVRDTNDQWLAREARTGAAREAEAEAFCGWVNRLGGRT